MDNRIDKIIEVLEQGLEKHGEKPLTNKWLLNIIKLADKEIEEEEYNMYQGLSLWDTY